MVSATSFTSQGLVTCFFFFIFGRIGFDRLWQAVVLGSRSNADSHSLEQTVSEKKLRQAPSMLKAHIKDDDR
jgi:hypothetical protein